MPFLSQTVRLEVMLPGQEQRPRTLNALQARALPYAYRLRLDQFPFRVSRLRTAQARSMDLTA